MNILLLGNGFDLAHGLPTTYKNFLDFLKRIDPTYSKTPITLSCELENLLVKSTEYISYINDKIEGNYWYSYFMETTNLNNNWCDFESEIEFIVKRLEECKEYLVKNRSINMENITNNSKSLIPLMIKCYLSRNLPLANNSISATTTFIEMNNVRYKVILTYGTSHNNSPLANHIAINRPINIPFEDLINFILNELNNFTKAFELYLIYFVSKIQIKKINFISNILFNKELNVINFNYTHTIDAYNQKMPICHIHGEINDNGENNLVLGIDETEDNIDPMFTRFRKYFQRFEKNCNHKYREWINQINHYNHSRIISLGTECQHLYIIGHSLTLSDKNILHELITLKGMKTTIYYYSDESKSNLMQNLAAILGYQDFTRYLEAEAITFVQGEFT